MNRKLCAGLLLALSILSLYAMDSSHSSEPLVTADICQYVLQMSKLPCDQSKASTQSTFAALDSFFKKRNIKDYADAAKFGRENVVFDKPESFNIKMGALFKGNSVDVVPQGTRKYQAIIFNTSGIDVFMERLAFLSRLTKSHTVQTDEVVALVGMHAHRQDLRNPDYLLMLPTLFASDFNLANFDKHIVQQNIESLNAQKSWTHRDGMEAAWKLTACDPIMNQLHSKFRYFSGDGTPSLRTEQLLEHLIAHGLQQPISKENPIAFIVNAHGAPKTIEMVNKYFADNAGAVDILIARPAEEEIEAKLFNDTPQQRAVTKLFHFYRILEAKINTKQ